MILLPVLLAACASPRDASDPEAAALTKCRKQADQTYLRDHRAALSMRDTRDTPFSSHGDIGLPSAGLGERYGRDEEIRSCLAAERAAAAKP